jgi:predicted ribosomally synthesized peptide with SipW-like signal peptide
MTREQQSIHLSRRSVLAGLGTVGAASAAAGLGTTAYFSDTETFENNTLQAGAMDTRLDWQQYYDGPNGLEYVNAYPDRYKNDPDNPDQLETNSPPIEQPDGIQDPIFSRDEIAAELGASSYDDLSEAERLQAEQQYREQFANSPNLVVDGPIIEVGDAKPGDWGAVNYSIHLFDEPGYLWLQGEPTRVAENGHTEPEAASPEETGSPTESMTTNQAATVDDLLASNVELLDAVETRVWYDQDNDETVDAGEQEIFTGTLRELFEHVRNGIPLDGDPSTQDRECFPQDQPGDPQVRYVGFRWWIPTSVGNEIQTDRVRFDLRFAAVQCRNNDGTQNPFSND